MAGALGYASVAGTLRVKMGEVVGGGDAVGERRWECKDLEGTLARQGPLGAGHRGRDISGILARQDGLGPVSAAGIC